MRFNFKKIASAASSALMIGSTVALAAAANYPAPFVSGSTSDVAIVVGQGAATTDFTAANSISSDLSTVFAAAGGSTNSTVDLSSVENIKLYRDGDKLNLGNTATTIYGTSTLTSSDLPMTLNDGTYTNDQNSDYDYEQRIALGSAGAGLQLNYFQNSDYKDRTPAVGVNLTSNYVVLNYTLDFTTDALSSVSGGDLVDFETTTLKMLGKEYYISDMSNATNMKMTLLDAANSGIVSEGETTTLTVDGNTYTVGLSFVSSTEAKLDVNGQVTNSLSEGGTFKLSDGSYVGIKDILYNAKDTGVSKVEFSIGKGKIELTGGSNVKINEDTINQLTAEIVRGAASSGKESLDRINLVWTTDDTEFVTPDSSLIMPELKAVALSMPQFVTKSSAEVSQLSAGGSDYVQLETELKDGKVTIPLLYGSTSTGNLTGLGKGSSDMLRTTNNSVLQFNYTAGHRYFVATWNSSNEGQSYYMKAYTFKTEDGINKTTLAKYTNGGWSDVCQDKRAGDTCNVGSLTLTLGQVNNQGSEKFVNLTISSGGSFNTLYTKQGLKMWLPWTGTAGASASGNASLGYINFTDDNITSNHGVNSMDLTFWTEDKNDAVALGSQFNVTINNNANNEFETSAVSLGRGTFTDPDDSNHIMGMVYGDSPALVERFGQSSDQRHTQVTYYGGEAYGDFRLSAYTPASQTSSGGALGDIVVTADKVATVGSKNLIVVGGSCINSVAADLLGSSSAVCGADFTQSTGVGAGSFLIQSFSSKWSTGKVALLVAGYNAEDTVNAAHALTSQKPDTMAGKKYTGSTATSLTPVTT